MIIWRQMSKHQRHAKEIRKIFSDENRSSQCSTMSHWTNFNPVTEWDKNRGKNEMRNESKKKMNVISGIKKKQIKTGTKLKSKQSRLWRKVFDDIHRFKMWKKPPKRLQNLHLWNSRIVDDSDPKSFNCARTRGMKQSSLEASTTISEYLRVQKIKKDWRRELLCRQKFFKSFTVDQATKSVSFPMNFERMSFNFEMQKLIETWTTLKSWRFN